MIKLKINSLSEFLRNTIAALLLVLICTSSFNVFALDNSYVDSPYRWNDVNYVVSGQDDGLSYSLKYIFDETEKSMYFYLYYNYKNVRGVALDKIFFGIRIRNSMNDYELMINNEGVQDRNNTGIGNKVKSYTKFSENNINRGTGKIFAAIELKDVNDRKLLNHIDCFFCVNYGNRILLLQNYTYDLQPPETTQKQTTAKVTQPKTTKQSSATTKTSTKNQTTKPKSTTSRIQKVTTTKFEPESKKYFTTKPPTTEGGTKSTKATQSKFSPSTSNSTNFVISQTITDQASTDEAVSNESLTDNSTELTTSQQIQEGSSDIIEATDFAVQDDNENTGEPQIQDDTLKSKSVMSKSAKVALFISVFLLLAGCVVLCIGIIKSLKKPKRKYTYDPDKYNDY